MSKHPVSSTHIAPHFLTAAELSARWKVTTITLRRWRHAGKIKASFIGHGVRFSMSEVERIEHEAQA